MMRIFISYSSKSRDKVRGLAQDLDLAGHQVWFDHKLTGGQAWWDQILEQIRQCDLFIFALTPDAMDSHPCKLEYTYAHDLGKNVLPVLLADGVSVNLLPPPLTVIQFVDYRGDDKAAAFRLTNALSSLPPPKPLPDVLPQAPPVPISYIGNLKDQIDSKAALSFDEQASLVLKLKERLEDPDTRQDAITLLKQLRKRDDLYARIGREIYTLLQVTEDEPTDLPEYEPPARPKPEPLRPAEPTPASEPVESGPAVIYQTVRPSPHDATVSVQKRVTVTPAQPAPSAVTSGDQAWPTWLVVGLAIGTFIIPLIGIVAGFIALRSPAKRNIGIGLLIFGGIMALIYVINALSSYSYYYGWGF
jgi:hypothetical protein